LANGKTKKSIGFFVGGKLSPGKGLPVWSCVLRYLVVSAVGGGRWHVCVVVEVMAGGG
jgi:hypothetical protein